MLKYIILCVGLALSGCHNTITTTEDFFKIQPLTYHSGATSLPPPAVVLDADGMPMEAVLKPKPIDLDTFKIPCQEPVYDPTDTENFPKQGKFCSDHKNDTAYLMAVADLTGQTRNRLLFTLLQRSDDICNSYEGNLRATKAFTGFGFGFAQQLFSAVAAVAGGAPGQGLSAASTITGDADSQLVTNVFEKAAIDAVMQAIASSRSNFKASLNLKLTGQSTTSSNPTDQSNQSTDQKKKSAGQAAQPAIQQKVAAEGNGDVPKPQQAAGQQAAPQQAAPPRAADPNQPIPVAPPVETKLGDAKPVDAATKPIPVETAPLGAQPGQPKPGTVAAAQPPQAPQPAAAGNVDVAKSEPAAAAPAQGKPAQPVKPTKPAQQPPAAPASTKSDSTNDTQPKVQKPTLETYTVEEALTDATIYHQACSFNNALTSVYLAASNAQSPTDAAGQTLNTAGMRSSPTASNSVAKKETPDSATPPPPAKDPKKSQ